MSTFREHAVCCLLPVVVLVAAVCGAAEPAEQTVDGRVTEVTLYDGQALVTRSIPLDGAKGPLEIVVGNLPQQVVPDSLFAEGNEGVEVRAVRFRTRAVGEEPRDEVRKLDEAIEQAQEALQLNGKGQQMLAKRAGYLDKLEGFVAPTADAELTKGVLNAETLEKVTLFSFEQREEITKGLAELEKQAKEIGKQISLLQRKRNELTSGASRTVYEALLFLDKSAEGTATVRLNYLVGDCGWSPAYTFRANGDGTEVEVECNGLIHQMTGEDWNSVALTLSTASPALSAAGPGLAPLPITLTKADAAPQLSAGDLSQRLQEIRQRQDTAIAQNRSAATLSDIIGSSWAVNAAANDFQTLEIISGKDLVNTLQTQEVEVTEGPSLSYEIGGEVSLASRSDQQMVRILQAKFDSRFYHVATPVLTNHVYREAELVNTSDVDLLAGPTTVYLDGRFVGRGEIPTVAREQMFVAGFGVDPQLRCRRELADKTESVQGGNRELNFKYRLIVENYKDAVVPVRLFDRLPLCERKAEVRVTLADMEDPISDDPLYLRRERPKGILRWDIEVAANATREKARIIEYGFKLEFDRSFQIATVDGGQQSQMEFEELQRWRAAPAAAEMVEPPMPAP